MLVTHRPPKIKYICGFLYRDNVVYTRSLQILERKVGPVDYQSQEIPFDFTDYYEKEMGPGLLRRFVSFKRLGDTERLIVLKKTCISIEKKFLQGGCRRINIDPGYVNQAQLILLTTKNFSHRIHLGKGIFAEVTLIYRQGKFCDLEWTYPDFRTNCYKEIFTAMRGIYRTQLNMWQP